jgi:TetR/AcrR family transcriptional regulator, mexJK operon transcriptional repressor
MPDPQHNASTIGRPTRAQAEARHAEMLDAALDMFLDKGFVQTTMEGVAAAVGMTKRTIYARYPDKAALFRATVQRAIEVWIVPAAKLRALESDDLAATLTAVARMRVAHVMTPVGLKLQRIINSESYRFPEIFTLSYEQATMPVINFLIDLLQRNGVARPDMAALTFMSMVVSGPVRMTVSGNALRQSEIEDRIAFSVDLFLNGAKVEKKSNE